MKHIKKFSLMIVLSILSLQLVACDSSTANNKNATSESTVATPTSTTKEVLNIDQPTTFKQVFAADEIDTFTNAGGTFSIDLPKDWLQDKSADKDSLITAKDEKMTASVMITKYAKGSDLLAEMKDQNIDTFVALYEEKGIPKLLSMVTPSPLEAISLNHFPTARGYEMVFSQNESNNKAYCAYVEGKDAYYTITISGNAENYDQYISALKGTLNTFKEFEVQVIN